MNRTTSAIILAATLGFAGSALAQQAPADPGAPAPFEAKLTDSQATRLWQAMLGLSCDETGPGGNCVRPRTFSPPPDIAAALARDFYALQKFGEEESAEIKIVSEKHVVEGKPPKPDTTEGAALMADVQAIKNVASPIRLWRVSLDALARAGAPPATLGSMSPVVDFDAGESKPAPEKPAAPAPEKPK